MTCSEGRYKAVASEHVPMVARQHKRRHCEQILIQIGPLQISTAYSALLEAILPHTSLYPHLSTTTPDHTIRHVAICVPRPLLFRTSIVFNQLNILSHVDSTKARHSASIWSPALYHGAQPALALGEPVSRFSSSLSLASLLLPGFDRCDMAAAWWCKS